jgi:cobalt-zinc-cadmium efflux system membrane fusion protein
MKHITNKLLVAVVFFNAIIGFTSCHNSATKNITTEKETAADTTKKETGIAELTNEQMKAVDIKMGTIEQKNLTRVVKASGQLTVPPQNKAVVNALVGGVIKKINVVEGQQVRKGQVVVVIENPDFIRLQQDYLTSKDNLVYLQQEYERQQTLKEADAGIGKVYQQASANYAAEKSKLQAFEKQLEQIHISPSQVSRGNMITQVPVLAPISGTVGEITLSVGTFTDASSPIMQIINNNTVYCNLQVYEKDIAAISVGQRVNFILTNQNDKQVSGRVTGINKSFEQQNKSVIVHAVLNNAASLNLIAGMYVSALIETGKQLVPAVPKDAIVKANDKAYIFIFESTEKEPVKKDPDDKEANKSEFQEKYRFKMIEVVTGVEELGFVQIKLMEELQPDTKIVTKGAFYLYSSMQNIETDDIQ